MVVYKKKRRSGTLEWKGNDKRTIDIEVEGLSREEVRNSLVKLPRNEQVLIHILKDGCKIFISTDGKKESKVNGKIEKGIDFTVHYDYEKWGLNYIDDVLVDMIKKEVVIGEDISLLVEAIKDSIELVLIEMIWKKYPKLKEFEKMKLKGHTIEFLLIITRWLGLQEDINYWGIKFKVDKETGKTIFNEKGERYEGREKPYHALEDLFIKRMHLSKVIKKHMLMR